MATDADQTGKTTQPHAAARQDIRPGGAQPRNTGKGKRRKRRKGIQDRTKQDINTIRKDIKGSEIWNAR